MINSSVAGVYAAAKKIGVKKYMVWYMVSVDFLQTICVDLDDYLTMKTKRGAVEADTVSAFLVSCRFKMPKIEGNEEVYEKVFEIMEKHDIDRLFYAGGNDSMDTVKMLSD